MENPGPLGCPTLAVLKDNKYCSSSNRVPWGLFPGNIMIAANIFCIIFVLILYSYITKKHFYYGTCSFICRIPHCFNFYLRF